MLLQKSVELAHGEIVQLVLSDGCVGNINGGFLEYFIEDHEDFCGGGPVCIIRLDH